MRFGRSGRKPSGCRQAEGDEAAEEQTVESLTEALKPAVATINETGSTINRISEISSIIAAAVEQQKAATQDMDENLDNAARGTATVATSLAEVNHGVGETRYTSAQVLSSARSLVIEGTAFKNETGKFLTKIRAA